MKNAECFGALNEIELDLFNAEGLLEIIGYVLQDFDGGCEAATQDEAKALCFAARCQCFSKMLFAALNGLQDTHERITMLLSQAQDACK